MVDRKFTIFVPIVASVNIRDIVGTGVLKEINNLLNGNVKFVILTIFNNHKIIEKFFEGLDVVYEKIPEIPFSTRTKLFSIPRMRSFLFALTNNLNTTKTMIGTFKAGTYGEKIPSIYYLYNFLNSFNNKILKYFYNYLRNALMNIDIMLSKNEDKNHAALFEKYCPNLILCHAPYARAQLPLQRVAVRKKIKKIGIICSWDNLTSSGEIPIPMDKLFVWSELMKEEAIKYHKYSPEQIQIIGPLQFDYYRKLKPTSREQFCTKYNLDPSKKILTYTCSSELLFPKEHLVVEQIKNIIDNIDGAQLLVRMYPTNEKLELYDKIKKKGAKIQLVSNIKLGEERFLPNDEFMTNLIETIFYSDVILNYPSTIIIDSFIFDKPVINIAFDGYTENEFFKSCKRFYKYEHINYVVDSKSTYIVGCLKECEMAIKEALNHPKNLIAQQHAFLKKICGNLDGNAHMRAAKFIVDFLKE